MADHTHPEHDPDDAASEDAGSEREAAGPAAPVGAQASERPTTLPENRRPLDNPRDSTETPSDAERERR